MTALQPMVRSTSLSSSNDLRERGKGGGGGGGGRVGSPRPSTRTSPSKNIVRFFYKFINRRRVLLHVIFTVFLVVSIRTYLKNLKIVYMGQKTLSIKNATQKIIEVSLNKNATQKIIDVSPLILPRIPIPPIPSQDERRQKKIVLLGPHERYNFGDILFSKVLARLLEQRAGYRTDDILFGALVSTDMTKYGGWSDIHSMKRIQGMSRNDMVYGPYDIVYTGGEALGCPHNLGVRMMQTPELSVVATREKIHDCAYLVPKKLLQPLSSSSSSSSTQNYAIVNSMGGQPSNACREAINSADFVGYRDKEPMTPDSAVMTKELYSTEIEGMAKVVLDELKVLFHGADNNTSIPKYIAVQHKAYSLDATKKVSLAKNLDDISRNTNMYIVFFAAGTAPTHDEFSTYQEIASMMKEPSIVYEAENTWKVVAVISRAQAVFCTSLHVRIMSFIYFKPRITWCSENKHVQFIKKWDAPDAASCVNIDETWSVLQRYVGPMPEITQEKTKEIYDDIIRKYLEFFDGWSSKLIRV